MGVAAIGSVAMGVVAMGVAAMGVAAVGIVMCVAAMGVASMGLAAMGIVALGIVMGVVAMGVVAVGVVAMGVAPVSPADEGVDGNLMLMYARWTNPQGMQVPIEIHTLNLKMYMGIISHINSGPWSLYGACGFHIGLRLYVRHECQQPAPLTHWCRHVCRHVAWTKRQQYGILAERNTQWQQYGILHRERERETWQHPQHLQRNSPCWKRWKWPHQRLPQGSPLAPAGAKIQIIWNYYYVGQCLCSRYATCWITAAQIIWNHVWSWVEEGRSWRVDPSGKQYRKKIKQHGNLKW